MPLSLVTTCALGLEEILADELRNLAAEALEVGRGAVTWKGGWPEVWRANFRLRTANRVLVELGSWAAPDGDALHAGAFRLVAEETGRPWAGVTAGELFHPDRTFALRATARSSRLTDPRWVALRVKDGLVDGQRRRWDRRGNVERRRPDLALRVWLAGDRASLLLDTSGDSLDRRGYRVAGGMAPVRETLGAAVVLASRWEGRGPIVDPMCGTGTLLAEAGWIALGQAPGRLRSHWAFEDLPGFDAAAFERIRGEAVPAPGGGEGVRLYGVDADPQAVAATRTNLTRAGLASCCELSRDDAFRYDPPEGPGLLVVNPAYGERMVEEPDQWHRLGDLLKQRYRGWRAVVLAGDKGKGKWIGLRPRRRIPVKNGPLDARILIFDLY